MPWHDKQCGIVLYDIALHAMIILISICLMRFQPCIIYKQISTTRYIRNFNAKCVRIAFNEHFKNECFDDEKESLSTGVNALTFTAMHSAIRYLKIPPLYTLQVHIRTV